MEDIQKGGGWRAKRGVLSENELLLEQGRKLRIDAFLRFKEYRKTHVEKPSHDKTMRMVYTDHAHGLIRLCAWFSQTVRMVFREDAFSLGE